MPRVIPPPRRTLRPEPAPNRKRWTRRECRSLVQSELLTGRYELIDGEIIFKMGQKRPHINTVTLIVDWLRTVFGEWRVQVQGPIDVAEADNGINEPEPDVAVLSQPITTYTDRNPGPADLLLVVEVSDTTLRFDLRTKAALYARAGIIEYWVVDLAGRRLIAHRQPTPEGYREVVEYAETEMLSPHGRSEAAVRVADMLPPA